MLLPILGYDCELWDLDSRSNRQLVCQAWRRGFHRGMGLLSTSSLTFFLGSSFKKAQELLRYHQLLFLWRAGHPTNDMNNFIYGSVGKVWQKTDFDLRKFLTCIWTLRVG